MLKVDSGTACLVSKPTKKFEFFFFSIQLFLFRAHAAARCGNFSLHLGNDNWSRAQLIPSWHRGICLKLHQHMGQQVKQLYTRLYKVKHPHTPATKTAKGREEGVLNLAQNFAKFDWLLWLASRSLSTRANYQSRHHQSQGIRWRLAQILAESNLSFCRHDTNQSVSLK